MAFVLAMALGAPPGCAKERRAPTPPIDGSALQPGDAFQERDACPRMLVVASSRFMMGAGETHAGKRVVVPRFDMAETETTVGAYRSDVEATGVPTYRTAIMTAGAFDGPSRDALERRPSEAHPVVRLSWREADAYAARLDEITRAGALAPSE